ncbi:MAG: CoA-binding protein [Planctomycetes bacterium]|nr:CoA-binding protein [Planctomycetota bacterium]
MADKILDAIRRFLASSSFAVVGAGNHMEKYGAKVFAAYRQKGLRAYPINPKELVIQGVKAYPALKDLPEPVEAISIIVPPAVTEKVVEEAAQAGVQRVWMQPGAESAAAVEKARSLGMEVIAGGPCVLVALGYREIR